MWQLGSLAFSDDELFHPSQAVGSRGANGTAIALGLRADGATDVTVRFEDSRVETMSASRLHDSLRGPETPALEAAVQAFSSSHGAVPLAPSARQAPPHALLQLQAAAVPLAPHALQPTFADVLAGL